MSEQLSISSIDSKKLILSNGSEYSDLTPAYRSWKAGDRITVKKKDGFFSKILHRLINETRNQEAVAFLVFVPGDLKKRLEVAPPGGLYPNIEVELLIKDVSGESIRLEDNSRWHMYAPALDDPGPWEVGQRVVVTQPLSKSRSKKYQMKNMETEKELLAFFLGRSE